MNRIVNIGEIVIGEEKQINEPNADVDANANKLHQIACRHDALHFCCGAVEYKARVI